MLLLIMISWLLISQIDFFMHCLKAVSVVLHQAVGGVNIFQGHQDPIKHIKRVREFVISLYFVFYLFVVVAFVVAIPWPDQISECLQLMPWRGRRLSAGP